MKVTKLITLAEAALATKSSDQFLIKAENYLASFDIWRAETEPLNPLSGESPLSDEEKKIVREHLERLQALHNQVIEAANSKKEGVGEEIRGVHKRASGLKKYIDRYPKRISITGKKQG